MEAIEISGHGDWPSFLVRGAESAFDAINAKGIPRLGSRSGRYSLRSIDAQRYGRDFLISCEYEHVDAVLARGLSEILRGNCDG